MKRSNNVALIASLFLFCVSALAGAQGIDVSIRFADKRVYYTEFGSILVQVTISNQSASTYRFKLADERAFSVDFDVRTLTNRQVDPPETLIRRRTQNQRVFFREVSVGPGESFSFVEDLRDYAGFVHSGSYVVQAKLYPELFRGAPQEPLLSNRLALSLRPAPLAAPGAAPVALDVATNAVLVRESMPPDQVLEYLLTARQRGQWEKFFLYLDLESMLTRDGVRRRSWLAESEEGRLRMLDRYRADLRMAVVDGDISTIPIEFTVERTTYGREEGAVTVLKRFRFGNLIERKRYTYQVRRRDGIWMVVDYSVTNLGPE